MKAGYEAHVDSNLSNVSLPLKHCNCSAKDLLVEFGPVHWGSLLRRILANPWISHMDHSIAGHRREDTRSVFPR